MNDAPSVAMQKHNRAFIGNISIVWIIPLIALAVALFVAWQSYSERGPLITIEFEDGSGIAPRETELRFRNVKVGTVEGLHFSEGLRSVIAQVRVDKDVAPFVDSAASFWVVRPELSASGISGLGTVLSGVYIEGSWDSEVGPARSEFSGLDMAPLYRSGVDGLQIALRSIPGGTLSADTPILYRGIEIGRVGPARISPEGSFAIAEALIYDPYGALVTPATRFWDTSGFSVSIGPSGAQIDFTSLATLVGGGITFDTFVSGGAPVGDGSVFEVHASEAEARNSIFNASEVETVDLRVVFDENISGLALDAPVELDGLRIGSVGHLSGMMNPEIYGDNRVRLNVVLAIQPARLGLQGNISPEAALEFIDARVRDGLRARLASGSLLTGGLKVELVDVENAPETGLEIFEGGIPAMPTTQSAVTDAAATVEGVFTRINSLPIEELLRSAIGFMEGARNLVASEALREAPEDLRGLLEDMRGVVTSQSVQDIPIALNATLARIDAILAQIEEEQAVARILAAIDATTTAAASVTGSVDGVPDLIAGLSEVAANALALPLADLTAEVTRILGSANALVTSPGVQQLPASLAGALDELNLTLAELREGGAVTNVNATLQSTRDAANAVALTTADLPALVDRMTQVFDQASATIEGYNQGEVISRDARSALRDISEASRAISALARLLERNPSALIRGR